MKNFVWWSCSALALGAVLSAESAVAQSQDTREASEPSGALAEIVVTAERRAEDLQNTPISVMAYSGQALERRGIDSIDDVSSVVPNASFGGSNPNAGGAPDFAIRGVGQTSARAFSEKGVGLYIDDIYYPRAVGSFLNLGDVQRIEVLRGPQGTLFGRNTTGGAIRYFTNPPVHDFEAEVSGTAGSLSRRDFNALINVPLGDVAALRVQLANFYREGYVDVIGHEDRASYGDQEDYAARASLLLEPSDNFKIRLTGAYASTSSMGDPVVILRVNGLGNPPPLGVLPIIAAINQFLPNDIQNNDPRWVSPNNHSVASNCVLDDPARLLPANFASNGDPSKVSTLLPLGNLCNEFKGDEQVFVSLDMEWQVVEGLTLRSLTGYNKGNHVDWGDYGLLGGSTNAIFNENESISQEFQLLGDTERVDWVAGLYYFTETPVEETLLRQLITQGPPPAPVNPMVGRCCSGFDRTTAFDVTSMAAFAQATLNLTDQLGFTAGMRYTHDEKSVEITKTGIFQPNIPAGPVDTATGLPTLGQRFQTAEDEWEAVDWRATLHFDWTDDVMTYVTAARSFKSGGFNGDITVFTADIPTTPVSEFVGGVEPFEPEFVNNYEIGIRSEWFDNHFRANVTGFMMDLDSTVIQFVDFTGGGLTLRSANAGYADLRGVEGEFELAPTEDFSMFANIGYTDFEWEHLNDNSLLFRRGVGTCPAAAPPGQPPVTATFEQCKDTAQPLTRTPEITYSVGFDWSHMIGDGELSAHVVYAFQDDIFSNNNTQNSVVLEGYGVTNVRLGYETESWRVVLFGANVLDEEYNTAGFNGIFPNSLIGTEWRSPGRPAEWGLKLAYRWY